MIPRPAAIIATKALARMSPSNHPELFTSRLGGGFTQFLVDLFGLTSFGVNLTVPRGTVSALDHQHSRQDELIHVVEGSPTLFVDAGLLPP